MSKNKNIKIAILGGTGNIGVGLSIRLAKAGYCVIVGSRDEEKAKKKAEEYTKIVGGCIEHSTNFKASEMCDVAILAIPSKYVYSAVEELKDVLSGKIVVSPAVPMKKENGLFVYNPPPEGSAAEKIASILKDSEVVSAFQTVPAKKFADLNSKFEWDVPVCGESKAKKVVMEIVDSIEGLKAMDAGDLRSSRMIEAITPLLINLAMFNNKKDLSVRFI